MGQEKHQKHTALTKPQKGSFHRLEWAFLGAPCGKIQTLCQQLVTLLQDECKVAYVDADHQEGDSNKDMFLSAGANMVCTDKIGYFRQDLHVNPDTLSFRNWFDENDLVLVNGNHFKANRQMVIVDAAKEESLKRKLDRLTQVDAIILAEGQEQVFPFLQEHLHDPAIPVLHWKEIGRIAEIIRNHYRQHIPALHGLVLAGGKSQRMGRDKGLIEYHGKPQRTYLAELIAPFCQHTFISCRPDQVEEIQQEGFEPLPDTFTGLGPFGAIASAFRNNPNAAWLVVASDLPLLESSGIQQLVSHRNPSKIATAFNSPVNAFPEPLVAIWEPRSYPALLQFLALGYACPRKVLINTDIARIDIHEPRQLSNVNNPNEYQQILEYLNSKT